jgi:hypothetical protein
MLLVEGQGARYVVRWVVFGLMFDTVRGVMWWSAAVVLLLLCVSYVGRWVV